MGHSLFCNLLFDDSDEDEIMRRCWYIERDCLAKHKRLYLDYFADTPVYPPHLFRGRFWMNRSLFLCIQSKVETYEPYFIQKEIMPKDSVYLLFEG